MTEIGEVKRGEFRQKLIWHACIDCGKERWVATRHNKPINLRCRYCGNRCSYPQPFGKNSPHWRGGRTIDGHGYMNIKIYHNNPYHSMADKQNYIPEHRLVMAQHLGRCLLKSEQVHHKNGIRDDNRIENLELISKADHDIRTKLCGKCELRKEIRLLRWQIKEQSEQINNLTSKLMGV